MAKKTKMSDKPTYMDCWLFIAPLIPVDTSYGRIVYCMLYHALKEAEETQRKKEG